GLGEEVAFLDLHLATEDLVARLRVALHLDALDVDERPAADRDDDVDFLLDRIELRLRLRLDVRVAEVAVERPDGAEVLHELRAVEVVAALRADELAERAPPAGRLDLLALVVPLEDLELADLEARPL